VVVLHGAGRNRGVLRLRGGWIALAQQYRLALLLPEQSSENNRARCQLFRPHDVKRGSGEAMSIRQMIRRAVKQFGSDPRQVFVVGFSAGGGMAGSFAGSLSIGVCRRRVFAGMPVGCARTPITALARMRRAIRAVADGPRGRCARKLAVAQVLARAWRSGKGNATRPSIPRTRRCSLRSGVNSTAAGLNGNQSNRARPAQALMGQAEPATSVDLWTIAQMGHGFPVDPTRRQAAVSVPGSLDAGVSGAQSMAAFWGLKRPRT